METRTDIELELHTTTKGKCIDGDTPPPPPVSGTPVPVSKSPLGRELSATPSRTPLPTSKSQSPSRARINGASRTSGLTDPYDMSTEDEVLSMAAANEKAVEKRASKRGAMAPVEDPEIVFRPEGYKLSQQLSPFWRSTKGIVIMVLIVLLLIGVIIGAVLGGREAAKRHPRPTAQSLQTLTLVETLTMEATTQVVTETTVVTVSAPVSSEVSQARLH